MNAKTPMRQRLKGSRHVEPREVSEAGRSEAEAIRQACKGDADGFEVLYELHGRRVYGLCLRMTRNPAEAEELTQECFMRLFRKLPTYRGESSFATWLHRLAVNTVLMELRKNRLSEVSLDATAEPGEEEAAPFPEHGGPDLRLSGVVDRVNLGRAIGRLPAGKKEIFILHDVEGYEHHEIAQMLGCSVGNCKSQLFKARLELRSLLRETLRSRAREKRESMRGSPVAGARR